MPVRAALPGDAEAISEIAAQTFALACPPDTPEAELQGYISENLMPEHFRAALADPQQSLRVIEAAGVIAGFSLIRSAPEPLGIALADGMPDGMPELSRCYVAAAHHGTGAAQALLSATLAQAGGPLRLTVNDQNPRAIRFYERNGFQCVGETRFQCGADLHRDLVMVRRPG